MRGGFLGFGFGEGAAGFADEHGEVVVIIDIGNEEVVFRTVIGRRHFYGAQEWADGSGGLEVEAVVTDEAKDLAVAVDGVVAKHLAGDNFSCPSALVGNVLHKIGVASHRVL